MKSSFTIFPIKPQHPWDYQHQFNVDWKLVSQTLLTSFTSNQKIPFHNIYTSHSYSRFSNHLLIFISDKTSISRALKYARLSPQLTSQSSLTFIFNAFSLSDLTSFVHQLHTVGNTSQISFLNDTSGLLFTQFLKSKLSKSNSALRKIKSSNNPHRMTTNELPVIILNYEKESTRVERHFRPVIVFGYCSHYVRESVEAGELLKRIYKVLGVEESCRNGVNDEDLMRELSSCSSSSGAVVRGVRESKRRMNWLKMEDCVGVLSESSGSSDVISVKMSFNRSSRLMSTRDSSRCATQRMHSFV